MTTANPCCPKPSSSLLIHPRLASRPASPLFVYRDSLPSLHLVSSLSLLSTFSDPIIPLLCTSSLLYGSFHPCPFSPPSTLSSLTLKIQQPLLPKTNQKERAERQVKKTSPFCPDPSQKFCRPTRWSGKGLAVRLAELLPPPMGTLERDREALPPPGPRDADRASRTTVVPAGRMPVASPVRTASYELDGVEKRRGIQFGRGARERKRGKTHGGTSPVDVS
jgi:hypothetical protein